MSASWIGVSVAPANGPRTTSPAASCAPHVSRAFVASMDGRRKVHSPPASLIAFSISACSAAIGLAWTSSESSTLAEESSTMRLTPAFRAAAANAGPEPRTA